MTNVTLAIAGRSYTVACAEGEETHVAMLGRTINDKLTAISNMAGQSETRTLLFATLLLADEMHEMRQRAAANLPAASPDDGRASELGPMLEKIALRIENLADTLEAVSSTP